MILNLYLVLTFACCVEAFRIGSSFAVYESDKPYDSYELRYVKWRQPLCLRIPKDALSCLSTEPWKTLFQRRLPTVRKTTLVSTGRYRMISLEEIELTSFLTPTDELVPKNELTRPDGEETREIADYVILIASCKPPSTKVPFCEDLDENQTDFVFKTIPPYVNSKDVQSSEDTELKESYIETWKNLLVNIRKHDHENCQLFKITLLIIAIALCIILINMSMRSKPEKTTIIITQTDDFENPIDDFRRESWK